jgi:DNA polymerase III sliding clamp (beta) subunit (PCNA family)
MRANLDTENLKAAVRDCQAAIPGKTIRPELDCLRVWLRDCNPNDGPEPFVEATDLELGIRVTLKKYEIVEEGPYAILLPVDRLAAILATAGDTVTIEADAGENIRITSEGSAYELPWIDPTTFPTVITEPDSKPIEVDTEILYRVLSTINHAASKELARGAMAGVSLGFATSGEIYGVATDGRRLATVGNNHGGTANTIPLKASQMVERLTAGKTGPCKITTGKNWSFTVEQTTIQTLLVAGRYPEYMRILPPAADAKTVVVITAGALCDAVKKATAIKSDLPKIKVNFLREPGSLFTGFKFTCQTETGWGQANVKAEPESGKNKPFELQINSKYLLEGLKNLPGFLAIRWHHHGDDKPTLITVGDYTLLIMPLS